MSIRRSLLQLLSSVVILTLLFSSFSLSTAAAQSTDGLKRHFNTQTGKVSFLEPESGRSLPASKALGTSIRPQDPGLALAKRFGNEFGLKHPERDLKQTKADHSTDGRLIAHYQQQYQGVPVMGGELIVDTNDQGDLISINGEVSPNLLLSIQPVIPSEQAQQTALEAVAKWYEKTPDDFASSEPELWIYDESLLHRSTRPVELVWRMEVSARDAAMPVRELVLVNAQRGTISLHFNQIDSAWNVGAQDSQPTPTPPPMETPTPTQSVEATFTPLPPDDVQPGADSSTLNNSIGESAALAATWYVSPSGNDTNSCSTSGSPCGTINGAIAKAGSGDTIRVASGTYTGTSGNVVVISKSLTLSGGWNNTFTTQNGASIVDGGGARNGMLVDSAGSSVVVEYFVIQNSYTTADSGGIYLYGASFTLRNSSVINNTAARGAGIFLINNAVLTMLNSTVSSNTAGSSGAGIYAVDGTVAINNSTIAKNSSSGAGGGLTNQGAVISIRNSILAKNTATGNGPDCSGALYSSDHNFMGNTTGCTVSAGAGDHLNSDPLIDLSLSGTLPLHALLVNSPAINAGDNTTCLASDERGLPRPNGSACDIGAYEYAATGGLYVISGSNQISTPGSAFAAPLTVYLIDSSASPIAGATISFTAPASGPSGKFADSGTNITSAITDANGYATSSILTANNQAGSFVVTAAASAYGYSIPFNLNNSVGDYYVSPSGSDGNSCTQPVSPCLTINAAIGKAVSGKTIAVAGGTYTGSGTEVVLLNKSVNLSGGWNSAFSLQSSISVIDGQGARRVIVVNSGATTLIDHFTVQNGFDPSLGGGIFNSGVLTVNNSIIKNNVSKWMGGGIYNLGTLTVNTTTIKSNSAGDTCCSGGGGGGGISQRNGTATINNSAISNNMIVGSFSGSGIDISAPITLNNSTVNGNTGVEGIYLFGGQLTLNNSTVDGNPKGGIWINAAKVWLNNSTVSNNLFGIASNTSYPSTVTTLQNSLVADNTSYDCNGKIVSSGHNLIENTSGCTFTPGSGDLTNMDPKLGTAMVGTPPYRVIVAGSPAIDAGDPATCLATDERGVSRPQGVRCDIGAYEYTVPGPAAAIGVVSGSDQRAGPLLPFPSPLVVYVVDSFGAPVSGASVTFTAPGSGASGTFATTGTSTMTLTTNPGGVATAAGFTANSVLGTYNVTAAVSGVAGTASFTLTNASWFVSPAGSDSNACSTPESPCLTIAAAITKAFSGDAIKVAIGTYTGTSTAVVNTTKDLILSGGWNSAFTGQAGLSTIDGQAARLGVYSSAAKLSMDRFIIQNGYAANYGGGIYNQSGALTISNGLIVNNQAAYGGGGIFTEGNLTVSNSTIRRNSSSTDGGGIELHRLSNSLILNNSTVADNQARNYGGGIALDYSSGGETPGTVTIQNSTIVNNSALGGGGLNNASSARALTLKNSILANNTGNSNGPNCYGSINSLDHSLLGNIASCSFSAGPDSLLNTDPLLNPYPVGGLAYYPLRSSSPAINAAANCLATDQRGVARPQGAACDMGAYEFTSSGAAASFGIADGSNQRTGTLRPFPKPLVVYVVDGAGSPVSGVNVIFTAPASGASGTFAASGNNSITVATNANGVAIASVFTANSQLGTYSVTASASGLGGSASFTLTNVDWFVAPSGSDSNTCTSPASPCVTINGAINKALNGDVIKVSVGTYTSVSSTVAQITKDLSLSGGWNTSFTNQTGFSLIEGGNSGSTGIWSSGSNVSITRFIVQNQQTGLYHSGGTLTVDRTALLNNGTAMYNYAGDATFTNVTISGSLGSGYAGSAISNVQGQVRILYSTITNNRGYYTIYSANGMASIKLGSSILARNTAEDCYIGSNPAFSEGYNIFGRSPACSGTFTLQPTDQVGKDPKLFSLLTAGYHPVLPGSPALDAGNPATCPGTDQRGVSRPVGAGCDIGAVEYRATGTIPAFILAYEGGGQSIPPGGAATTRLKAVVLDANGDGVSGTGVTFTGPSSGASLVFADTHTYASSASTDSKGLATSAAFSANNVIGSYVVSATVAGVASPANFELFNGTQKIKTYTANNGISLPGTFLCDQLQLNCTNGSNPHADAAHQFAIGTYNFYMTQHQRDSIDNHNMTILSSVHYYSGYSNAFWNGEQMVYGDAYGFPLADDVVAHELTHGVTQYESNLFYYYQSGAINESFSDLWGEYYDQTNGLGTDTASVKWQLGEDVSGMGALRNMSNPPAFGDPDKMSSPYYYEGKDDSGGVHTNSGVNNKAIFLLVDGGTFNGKTVTGLGWGKTGAIYYEVNTNLLSSGADYSDLYYALQQACTNLIGQKGITAGDCTEVKNAVDAVEMNGQPAPNFNTDAPYCDSGTPVTTVLSDDLESGTGNWTFSNGAYTRWQVDSPYGVYAQSGLHSLYADDYPDVVTDASARLKSFVVPSNAYLRFAQAYDFEASDANYDGGVLEYSTNNGATWQDAGPLIDFNGYKGTIFSGSGNPLSGRSAFVGSSHGYIGTRLNLFALAGQTVSFRWRMGLDEDYSAWGWWLDQVEAYSCPVILSKVTTGVFRPTNGALYLKNSNTVGYADLAINYGIGGDYPVTGDWNGDGIDTIGVYRNGVFYLRNSNTIGYADLYFAFGSPGDQPVAGDWDGDGIDTIGVYHNGTFSLRNSNTAGAPQMTFQLGIPGDVGIAGDWDGDGIDTTGVFRPSNGVIFLKNSNTSGYADIGLNYGIPGDKPVTGDWNGDGIDTIGVYRGGTFYLRNSNTVGYADLVFALGIPTDMPIAGNWDGLP